MALLSGISEAKILEVKQTEIHEKASQSIKSKGWLPNLFRGIVTKAKDFLQNLIREKDMPPKPTLDIDMAEFRHMRNLMIKVQDKAVKIKNFADVCNHRFTMASADFSPFVVTDGFHTLFPSADETSLGTTRHFLSIYLPHLLQLIPSSYWTLVCCATLSLTIA